MTRGEHLDFPQHGQGPKAAASGAAASGTGLALAGGGASARPVAGLRGARELSSQPPLYGAQASGLAISSRLRP